MVLRIDFLINTSPMPRYTSSGIIAPPRFIVGAGSVRARSCYAAMGLNRRVSTGTLLQSPTLDPSLLLLEQAQYQACGEFQ